VRLLKHLYSVYDSRATIRKKCFNGGYLVKINIVLEIDLINGFFLTFVKFQRLF